MGESIGSIFNGLEAKKNAPANQEPSTKLEKTPLPPGVHPVTGKRIDGATGTESPIADSSAHMTSRTFDEAVAAAVKAVLREKDTTPKPSNIDTINKSLSQDGTDAPALPNFQDVLPPDEVSKLASNLVYKPSNEIAESILGDEPMSNRQLLAMANDLFRQFYTTVMQHSGLAMQAYMDEARQNLVDVPVKRQLTGVSDQQALNSKLRGLQGITSEVRSNLESLMSAIRADNPDAPSSEIAASVLSYVEQLRGVTQSEPTIPGRKPKKTDWGDFFGLQ